MSWPASDVVPSGARRLARAAAGRFRLAHDVSDLADEVVRLKAKAELLEQRIEKRKIQLGRLAEHLVLDYDKAEIKIVGAAQKRQKAQTKEPFTVSWIERSLSDGAVFYDIGANVGTYSLIAAASAPAARIFAFEPGYANFATLCEHVVLNGFGDRITPLPVTLGTTTGLMEFRYSGLLPGDARHNFEEGDPPPGFQSVYEQHVLAYRLDDLVRQFGLPQAHHIKLDVDGSERAVLEGAVETIRSPELRSVIVEVTPGDDRLAAQLREAGLEMVEHYGRPRPDALTYAVFARA